MSQITMSDAKSRELAVLDKTSRMLGEVRDFDDILGIRNKAEAVRAFAQAAKLGLEVQNRAAALKLRAERKAGEFLAGLKLRGGDRKSKGHAAPLILEDMGISRDESKRWQKQASVPEKEFEKYLRAASDLGEEVTAAGLLRLARSLHNGQPSTSRGQKQVQNRPGEAGELVDEISNHRQLLSDVLSPVYKGEKTGLEPAQRRLVARLLKEMDGWLGQLRKLVQ